VSKASVLIARGLSWALRGEAMELKDIIAFVARFGTRFATVADLTILRRRSTEGMNPRVATIMGTFQSPGHE
jgi:hypothetical protein